jgi:hypothetical protein
MDELNLMKIVSDKIMRRERTIKVNGKERPLSRLSETLFSGRSKARIIESCDGLAMWEIRRIRRQEEIITIE